MSCALESPEERRGQPKYPMTFTRTFLCGHPQEYIKVTVDKKARVQHVLLPSVDKDVRLNFSLQRCRKCAAEHQTQRKATHAGKPMRALKTSQGEVMRERNQTRNGFAEVLNRFVCGDFFERATRQHGKLICDHVPRHERLDEKCYEKRNPIVMSPNGASYKWALRITQEELKQREERRRERRKLKGPVETVSNSERGQTSAEEWSRDSGHGQGGSTGTEGSLKDDRRNSKESTTSLEGRWRNHGEATRISSEVARKLEGEKGWNVGAIPAALGSAVGVPEEQGSERDRNKAMRDFLDNKTKVSELDAGPLISTPLDFRHHLAEEDQLPMQATGLYTLGKGQEDKEDGKQRWYKT